MEPLIENALCVDTQALPARFGYQGRPPVGKGHDAAGLMVFFASDAGLLALAALAAALALGFFGAAAFLAGAFLATAFFAGAFLAAGAAFFATAFFRSEEHTSELQSLMRISYALSCLKQKKQPQQ